jgi:hypothetical protein
MKEPPWPPDWRNAAHYRSPRNTSPLQWAWEFLRRNPEYQTLWAKRIKHNYKPANFPTPAIPEFRDKFHIIEDPPPSPAENKPKYLRFGPPFILLRGPGKGGPISLDWSICQNEMIVFFDLTYPIPRQLQVLNEAMVKHAPKRTPEFRFNRWTEKYPTYLRLLDAIHAGVDQQTIIQNLYNLGNQNARQTFRDHLRAAKLLRDKDFWRIAMA